MSSLAPINVSAGDKLRLLQRLDQYRRWASLDDKRQCIQCGEIISGREIEIVGGTRALGPLRLQCPTPNCRAIPIDWIMPNNVIASSKERGMEMEPNDALQTRAPLRETKIGGSWFRRLLGQPS